jgi:UDP-N-acetylbacillosamine N-acetyltransferase
MGGNLVIWGASGHARVVADIVRLQGTYDLVGFLDDTDPGRHGSEFDGLTVLGGSEKLDELKEIGVSHLIIGFGDCAARLKASALVREKGFSLATAIHPKAVVAGDAVVAAGTVIAAGAVVNPGATINENVIINTGATVDHECNIEEGVHVCPGVHVAGHVNIGRASWIGIGAIVSDHLRIGANTVIGAGAVVVHDIPDNVVAYGVPARVVKKVNGHA